jgi:hypothetical protein
MPWYNGYSPAERAAKGKARLEYLKTVSHLGCAMCRDDCATTKRWLHSEDYSRPYRWDEPAVYVLCDRCHRRLHARFANENAWRAYCEFLRRGWYGREIDGRQIASLVRRGERYSIGDSGRDNPSARANPWWEMSFHEP